MADREAALANFQQKNPWVVTKKTKKKQKKQQHYNTCYYCWMARSDPGLTATPITSAGRTCPADRPS